MRNPNHIARDTRLGHGAAMWLSLLLSFLGLAQPLVAQQDPHHTQYLFNGLAFNPAYAGSRGTLSGMLFARQQWIGMEGAPSTQSFSFHMPGTRGRSGFGINLINDRIGYTSQQWGTLSYAYIIPIGQNGRLALGLRGGAMNYRIDWSKVQANDMQDPILANGMPSIIMPNVGTGAYFSTDLFYAGLSMPHILNTPLRARSSGANSLARLYRHAYLTSGIVLGRGRSIQWKPSILLKYAPGAPLELDLNVMALLAEKLWIGASWRSADAVAAMLDFQIARQFHVGYAYDYSITPLRRYHNGTHEFVLGFELSSKTASMRSPRFF